MPKTDKVNDYKSRAHTVREIAKGIFDHVERRKVLELVDEYEKIAASKEPARRGQSNGGSPAQGTSADSN